MAEKAKPATSQLQRFKQAARKAEADESEEAFKRRLAKVAKARPADQKKAKRG